MPFIANAPIVTNTVQQQQEYILAQQMAMQQYYMQYMQQYMNAYQQQPNNVQQNANIPPMPFFTQQPFDIPAVVQRPQQPVDPAQIANQQQAVPPQLHADNNQVAAPRFGNIAAEDGERLDWLDLFYVFSRLMVLVTLVYFYSSPSRCLIVIFFSALYYL